MVKVLLCPLPLIVIVPLRSAAVFAATEKVTVPLPVPDEPLLRVIHEALLTAVQVHPVPEVVTATPALLAPLAGKSWLAGLMLIEQPFS